MPAFVFDHAWLPQGWARDVAVSVEGGMIAAIDAGGDAGGAGERIHGAALPGLANLHCHSFQRGMAGLSERRGPGDDTFWTWREVMYRFLGALTPDDVEAIAAFAYMEMIEGGFTSVGEFHYLHHDVDGRPYGDIGEMAARVVAAAVASGIGLTLLPSFYANGGFAGAAPLPGQRRFINDVERFHRLLERTRAIAARTPGTVVGIAPHSLRAVTPEALRAVVAAAATGPIHIHAAEQAREVDDCLAVLGARPVEWLLANFALDRRWCLIHATHMNEAETRALAASGAVAGLCPLTEASLGDGIFPGAPYLAGGGRFGIGTDSNIDIHAAGELRQLEYSQRLAARARNVLTLREGESTGERLYAQACAGGAQALARPQGAIAVGRRADFVVLDRDDPDLAGDPAHWLDAYVFVGGRRMIDKVIVGGERLVERGRHAARARIAGRYRAVVARLAAL
ncbi:MAG: formimidoylglutamate deiminase [Proteobacteria bacterium]|nr:formimidoylglutamate deiminase [Pseudomonadota bacterium]